ncbi:hypothetical protein [Tenacibaculum jejuense]|uniref:Probable lipoprotein n=1 Tax=Tenacibaculum jejuense TaxID=584609 RepID=A0A238UCG0_9FLAO|nr:hypothetical protein [Tenacibaculum jejuense]SNR16782.1 Probable lipoprotein precursor [Tenacibaculum jejuense]
MRKLGQFFILFTTVLISCKGQEKEKVEKIVVEKKEPKTHQIKSLQEFVLTEDKNRNYQQIRNTILEQKRELLERKQFDSLSQFFETALLHRIIPQWEGTVWSFEGYTSTPKKGEIACGYFISTTLKHIGFNINRYQLAQQSPINEAKTLALENKVIEIFDHETDKIIQKIKEVLPEGIHFIGFDAGHVGYILKKKGELYLIHSNYLEGKVGVERIQKSTVFASFFKFYLVELSTNKQLLEKWIKNEEIIIKK